MTDGKVLSVNVGVARPNPAKRDTGLTGIDKLPVDHAVDVRAPGPKTTGLHSGVVGDPIGDIRHHGGDDQAVYAYSREDYDWWEASLGRSLPAGMFGENMTTAGLDLNRTLIGEVWRVGDVLELQPTFGRIPCATFQAKMGEKQWLKRFAREARTGAYLRVVTPGPLRAGDPIEIVHRPATSIGVSEAFDIYMHRTEELERLLVAEALPADLRDEIERRVGRG
ncbi:MAG: MOSC domain-containing protein [Actinomycetota bacterium]|nr:MOSC domain-containing protein [Actinomycetota bacterium]